MKKNLLLGFLLISLLLAACGESTPTLAPTITLTPDLCSSANLPSEVAKVNNLMREFDDYSSLASNTPQTQLIDLVPEMQRVLRSAEDLQVPACLQALKNLEMAHMNLVIQILMAFMNSSVTQINAQAINTGIAQARDLHSKYDVEMARLLGITLVVPPTSTVASPPDANLVLTPTISVVYVTNPGPMGINLRSSPALNAPEAGIFAVQASAIAIGKSADSQWIKVEIPGQQPEQMAWVFASLVQLSMPINQLPVVK